MLNSQETFKRQGNSQGFGIATALIATVEQITLKTKNQETTLNIILSLKTNVKKKSSNSYIPCGIS